MKDFTSVQLSVLWLITAVPAVFQAVTICAFPATLSSLIHSKKFFTQKPTFLTFSTCPIVDKKNYTSEVSRAEPTHEFSNDRAVDLKALGPLSALGFLHSSLRGTPHKFLARLQKKYGENFIIPPNIVVLNDPKAIKDVLEMHNLPKTPKVRSGYKTIFYGTPRSSGGILAAPWKKWIEQRRMTSPALAEKVIGGLAPKFYKASLPFFAYLDSVAIRNTTTDLSNAFTAVTMDIIGNILLGKSFGMCEQLHDANGTDQGASFATALHTLTDETVRQMVLPDWWLRRRPKVRKVVKARKVIDDFLEEAIRERLNDNRNKHDEDKTSDLLNILLEAEAAGIISHEEVKGQLLTFVFAGFDTLAPTLTYMLWEITQHDSLQNELAAEARMAIPNQADFPTSPCQISKHLRKLDQTFSETNRKHPAAAMGTSRKVGRESIIVGDGLVVPAQSSVLIPPWTLHRNERFWPDPEAFNPSRFEHVIEEPFSYQPFSGGPRNCIGAQLARAEALCLLGTMIRRFEICCNQKDVPADHYSLTRKPRKGVYFKLKRRPM